MALHPRSSVLKALLVWVGLGLGVPAWGSPVLVLDRIVAAVNGQIITLTELRDAMAVAELRGEERPASRDVLAVLIDQKLLHQEALRYRLVTVLPEEVAEALSRLKAGWPSDDAFLAHLERIGLSLEAVERMLERQIRIRKFLQRRIFVHVGSEEVRRFYETHRERFQGRPFTAVREEIRRYLEEQARNTRMESLVRDLRRRADIRINREALRRFH